VSEHLETQAEIAKLARLLGVEPTQLQYLADLPSADLRHFRDSVTDRIFGNDAHHLGRVVTASKLVPIPVAAKGAQHAFGPLLCAALSGLIEPSRGVATAARLPDDFLAEASIDMDPRRSAGVIAAMPPQTVAKVGRILLDRHEYVTMGRFVGVLPEASVRAAAPEMSDADLLRIAFVLEDKSHLDDLMNVLSDRLVGIVRAAYAENLWAEALDLLGNLSLASRSRLGDLAANESDELIDSLILAADRLEAWSDLLPLTAAMSEPALTRFAASSAIDRPETLSAIMRAALDGDLWLDLLPLAAQLPMESRAVIAAEIAAEDEQTLTDLIRAAHLAGEWNSLIPIATAMTQPDRQRLANLALFTEDDVLLAVVRTASTHQLWAEVTPLVDALPTEALTAQTPAAVWDALVAARGEMPAALLGRLRERAAECGLSDTAAKLASPPS
jgi:hypothetical protein